MANLRKVPWKKRLVKEDTKVSSPGDESDRTPVSRRSRDWDTRLFVLSTLKRMVDREHFEELDEEDNRTPLTRETLQMRKQLMEGRNQRQRRRKKDEKLIPTSRLTGKIQDEDTRLNTRDKQRIERTRQLQLQGIRTKAGKALTDALQKVEFIKSPQPVSEMPEEIINPNNEVPEQKDALTEQGNEEKEQNRVKRSFFNFSVKKD